MPEMGVEGLAEVLAIEPCPPLEEGEGRLVTGTFKHTSGEVYDLKLASESKPLGVTATHPFWSVDRNAWVSAIDLEIGETLKTLTGTTVVESRSKRKEPETVYNIEVEGDHVYRVGESGVLVHNVSQQCNLFPEKEFGGSFCTEGGPTPVTGPRGRTQKIKARICDTGGGERATVADPWDDEWNAGLPRGSRRVDRCHLIGDQLGGLNNLGNIVACCARGNRDMSNVENRLRRLIDSGGCADVLVEVTYYRGTDIAHFIRIKAVIEGAGGSCDRSFTHTVTNPPNLGDCPVLGPAS